MKRPLILLGLLLLALLLALAGSGAFHRPGSLAGRRHAGQPLPLRVVRTPAVAKQHREVRVVKSD